MTTHTPQWRIRYIPADATHHIRQDTWEVTDGKHSVHVHSGSEAQWLTSTLNQLEYRSHLYDALRAQFSAGEGKAI